MKRRSLMKCSEKSIQDAILQYAASVGVVCFRRNVGAVRVGPRFLRFAKPGQSDLWGWDAQGVHYEFEVKRPGGKPSLEQITWLDRGMQAGIHTALIDNVDDGIRFIDDMSSTGDNPYYRAQWRKR